MQSTHVESMVELATVHLIKEESTKAREYFESALKLDNSNVIANLRIGKMYQIQMNNHRQALFHFDKVTEKDPLQFRAFFLAAHSQVELKESQKALASLKQCLKINSIYGPAWKLIGDILYEENNISNAAKYYKKSIELDPNDTESKVTLANCEYMLENYRSAIKLYEDIIKNDQSQDDIYYNLGNSYYMLNEF
jgi:tetratricopeptide (TPR) repeat protein